MNLNEDYDMIVKIILIGDSGVGKTNFLSQYLKKQFKQDFLHLKLLRDGLVN